MAPKTGADLEVFQGGMAILYNTNVVHFRNYTIVLNCIKRTFDMCKQKKKSYLRDVV